MSSVKPVSRAQILSTAHILENFAKKGMVGYPQPTIQGGAKRKGGKKKPATKKTTGAKKTTKKTGAKKSSKKK